VLAVIAGAVISLVFSYVPALRERFDGLQPNQKRLAMLGVILVVSVAIFGLSCAGVIDAILGPLAGELGVTAVACNRDGALALLNAFIYAAMANQTTYSLTPKPVRPSAQ
jgi:hypothetical protein